MAGYDMDPDAVTANLNRLRAAGEDFAGAWEKRKHALRASEAGIGGDLIAQAFLERYRPLAERLTTRADGIPAAYRTLCDDALCCVADYRAADATGSGALTRLTGTDGHETAG
ncbi:hypothetical protein [Prauserella muralis]|uniref:Uncharacterized protein n=1 Tax=Prauserella muralis TaxID=588067 RepID=A0A2V4AQE5_9PSEU|nr:hypothetical protein [Prauserella muralis]PXY22832.1 hypothetical protein BAY60_23920 [Prauserella muralis]TWE28584.1 hypothetical protein FHX69_1241 [Prauserella muralis]